MIRTGIGFDVHPLVEERELWLGGVRLDGYDMGLDGHSDADVVCHAICDALLGAVGLGDIGEFFPNTDPAYRDYPGVKFLDAVRVMIAKKKYEIVNVDCTVMSDAVRLGERKKDMQVTIASYLEIDTDRVCVKATSFEGYGAVGRGEVIAAQAVATVTPTRDK
jgi:2-C-methyl-D-erythritol 2,4-cyclodiphosphate synthase